MITTDEKREEVLAQIQGRCLWQFFSRAWDREENINGILMMMADIMTGETSHLETSANKYFYADAKIVTAELKACLPWLNDMNKEELKELLNGVKERLLDITVKNSLNGELRVKNY
ncbi:MAG: V-containing nitrogenase subunit delta [Methanothrix sp.]|nr:V-containing nitrogenase subunit delta [Methanothrix sp.]